MKSNLYPKTPKGIFLASLCLSFILGTTPGQEPAAGKNVNALGLKVQGNIHVASGLVVAEGFEIVVANCVACHSGKLIAQNKATRQGWKNLIRWMQKTQKLWDLGENEEYILDYLEKNYAPKPGGRRAPLKNIQWHSLDRNS